jgi:2-iminoacetate synthase
MINEKKIWDLLGSVESNFEAVKAVIKKTASLQRLDSKDVACLIQANDSDSLNLIFRTAEEIKRKIYGKRLVFFAPLYVSSYCSNSCLYCAFRVENKTPRSRLTFEEIEKDTKVLLKQGHKRVLLVAGETYPQENELEYIFKAIETVYKTKEGNNSIRRINVNIAPLSVDDFKRLKATDIGTYQIFQETYHRETYKRVHPKGMKADYDYRLTSIDRAFEAGIDDVGMGVLYGLSDWRFDTLALLQHIEHLENKYGMGPHTISVPRIEPAVGSDFSNQPYSPVSDNDFKKLVAILRLAVPYTGIIMSTRESEKIRREALGLGISQISAGSKTSPGGYEDSNSLPQFSLGDHRSLDDVMLDVVKMGYIPSFCTACYRLGRVGLDFMEYAKPGDIGKKCSPNALMSFKEYLCDFASPELKKLGDDKLNQWLSELENETLRASLEKTFVRLENGERDIFV